jgi:predicted O-linked N-acetylglucosamine transferase (SPINDLY family)
MVARVAASLLEAVGLPELITDSLAAYEARALELSRDRAMLAALHDRLRQNRATTALFDADRFRRHFEAGLSTMHARHAAGLPPESFEVLRDAR